VNEPQNQTQSIILRVAAYCVGRKAKALIVASGRAVKGVAGEIAQVRAHQTVEVLDVTGVETSGKTQLTVEPQFHAVLIAADSPQTMNAMGRLCGAYQHAGIPVVVIAGWPAPMDARQFQIETSYQGYLNTPGMFDLVAAYCRGGNAGDILEFGTFQGYSLQCAYHAFHRRQIAKNRRFIAFDSFAGIVGTKAGEAFTDGTFAATETSFRFANVLAEVPNDQVRTIAGPYQVTLGLDLAKTRALLEPIDAAVVHIDCDVEAAAKLALDFVTPYLKQGALLLFDEFDQNAADNAKGERAALRAWLNENPAFDVELYRPYHARARSFIVHRR
jgi:hypothetical protein